MGVRANKTCKACGHNWYPTTRTENACPVCGGTELVFYIEPTAGGGSSFVPKKGLDTLFLVIGIVVCGAVVFFWYTENFDPQANPFRELIDGKGRNEFDAGTPSTTPAPSTTVVDPVKTQPDAPAKTDPVPPQKDPPKADPPVKRPPKPPVEPVGRDQLHLVDGRVLQGKIAGTSDGVVLFRWRDEDGKIQTQSFTATQIQRVERASD